MTTLYLNLKREYYDDIANETKIWEYRLRTDFWKKRLVGRVYENTNIALGYPKKTDMSRRLIRPWRGYEIQPITHKHFGPNPVEVFAIRVN